MCARALAKSDVVPAMLRSSNAPSNGGRSTGSGYDSTPLPPILFAPATNPIGPGNQFAEPGGGGTSWPNRRGRRLVQRAQADAATRRFWDERK